MTETIDVMGHEILVCMGALVLAERELVDCQTALNIAVKTFEEEQEE